MAKPLRLWRVTLYPHARRLDEPDPAKGIIFAALVRARTMDGAWRRAKKHATTQGHYDDDLTWQKARDFWRDRDAASVCRVPMKGRSRVIMSKVRE